MAKSNENIANGVFKENPELEEVFVTSDGLAFPRQNSAELHAKTNPSGKVLKVTSFKRSEAKKSASKKEETKKAPAKKVPAKKAPAKKAAAKVPAAKKVEDKAAETKEA